MESAKGSFDDATEAITAATGATVGKRQTEDPSRRGRLRRLLPIGAAPDRRAHLDYPHARFHLAQQRQRVHQSRYAADTIPQAA